MIVCRTHWSARGRQLHPHGKDRVQKVPSHSLSSSTYPSFTASVPQEHQRLSHLPATTQVPSVRGYGPFLPTSVPPPSSRTMQQYHLWDHRLLLGEKRPVNSLGEADMGGMKIRSLFLPASLTGARTSQALIG